LNVNSQLRNGFGELVGGVPGRGNGVGDQAGGQVGVEDFPVVGFIGIVDEIAVDVVDDLLELVVVLWFAFAFGRLELQADVDVQNRGSLVLDVVILDRKGERLLFHQVGHFVIPISCLLSADRECWLLLQGLFINHSLRRMGG